MHSGGTLSENLIPVKLPATKPGKATTFRIGRETERKAWVATLPGRHRLVSAAYENGKIFVGGGFETSAMYALEATTGKRLWVAYNLQDPGPTSAVVDQDELAFDTFSCSLAVLAASTGKVKWQKWIGSETPTQPAFSKDYVLAPHPSDGGYVLTAYHRANGANAWSSAIDNHSYAPIVSGDSVYVATTSGTLYRITLDGKRVWSRRIHALSAPWISGDEVHVAVREGSQEAQVVLSAADGKRLRTVTSERAVNDAPGGDTMSLWWYEGSRPVVANGVQYSAMGDRVEARDVATNQLRWERHVDSAAKTATRRKVESVVVAGRLALITTRDGKIVGLDTRTGAQRMGFDFDTPITAEPIVAKGWMYVATARGQVLAFDLGDAASDGWHMWGGNAQHNL
jgi:Ca-activated chloride channel family protein